MTFLNLLFLFFCNIMWSIVERTYLSRCYPRFVDNFRLTSTVFQLLFTIGLFYTQTIHKIRYLHTFHWRLSTITPRMEIRIRFQNIRL